MTNVRFRRFCFCVCLSSLLSSVTPLLACIHILGFSAQTFCTMFAACFFAEIMFFFSHPLPSENTQTALSCYGRLPTHVALRRTLRSPMLFLNRSTGIPGNLPDILNLQSKAYANFTLAVFGPSSLHDTVFRRAANMFAPSTLQIRVDWTSRLLSRTSSGLLLSSTTA